MPAYVFADVQVTDAARYERYRALTPAAIAHYGGKFLVRGGATTVLEGAWQPNRVVVIEFPDVATAQRFYDSPEYRAARAEREGAARMRMFVVEGV
jgi:uncharacterized protein (DUF1330 family)